MKQTKRKQALLGLPDIEWEWPHDDSVLWKAAPQVSFVAEVLTHVPGRRLAIQAGSGGGVYPVRLALEFERVFTFEVEQRNITACKENFREYPNITLIEAAVGKDHRKRKFISGGANSGAGYLDGLGEIPTVRIDDYGLNPDLIWLDIQGHEPEAIEGAMDTIRRCHPAVVLEQEMIAYMKNWGFNADTAGQMLVQEGYTQKAKGGHDVLWT